jgi:hypothetical protein
VWFSVTLPLLLTIAAVPRRWLVAAGAGDGLRAVTHHRGGRGNCTRSTVPTEVSTRVL